MSRTNHHCNVLVVADYGIMLEGESGSGKTSLTLGLLDKATELEIPAKLVSDDQVYLESSNDGLVAIAPETIAGKLELRGYGIVDRPFCNRAEISLIVQLKEDPEIVRMPERKERVLMGRNLPVIEVPVRHEQAAVRIVFAWLGITYYHRQPVIFSLEESLRHDRNCCCHAWTSGGRIQKSA